MNSMNQSTTRASLLSTFRVRASLFRSPPNAPAVSPPPNGGYPGGNTAEGQNALLEFTTGGFNTAVGYLSLGSNTTNSFNTALGAGALLANVADSNTATGAGALLSNTTGGGNTANGDSRSLAILAAVITRLMERSPSLTPPAGTTRPTVLERSRTTPKA